VARSTKAGIASAALLLSILIPPYAEWRVAFNIVCAVLACVLGALAGSSGKRWWLVIPGSIVTGFAVALYLAVTTP
jgi:hypothetical protein